MSSFLFLVGIGLIIWHIWWLYYHQPPQKIIESVKKNNSDKLFREQIDNYFQKLVPLKPNLGAYKQDLSITYVNRRI